MAHPIPGPSSDALGEAADGLLALPVVDAGAGGPTHDAAPGSRALAFGDTAATRALLSPADRANLPDDAADAFLRFERAAGDMRSQYRVFKFLKLGKKTFPG